MLGYAKWLHTRWPAGTVEKLPRCNPDGSTNVPGLYIVGDLTGIPLLKFSADTGARAVMTIAADPAFQKLRSEAAEPEILDLVILGGGVSGMAAALEARKRGLRFELLEASEPFSTIVNFPKGKPIYTYPTGMTPAGDLQFTAQVKEPLVEEIRAQTQGITPRIARAERVVRKGRLLEVVIPDQPGLLARRVIVAIGRSGNFRKLGVPGEDKGKVYNRLHDPKEFAGKQVLVVGGGDSALECAIACAQCGAHVLLSYRKKEFARPKPDNVERLEALRVDPMADVAVEQPTSERVTTSAGPFLGEHRKAGSIRLLLGSAVKQIEDAAVTITDEKGATKAWPNDVVFTMIGREAPLSFFRRSGVKIAGEWNLTAVLSCLLFLLFCFWLYPAKTEKLGADSLWGLGKVFAVPVDALKQATIPNVYADANVPPPTPDHTVAMVWNSELGHAVAMSASSPEAVAAGGKYYIDTSWKGVLGESAGHIGFWYSLVYCVLVAVFGWRRIRRRATPYVRLQTLCLTAIQIVPLFLLPYVLLPYLGLHDLLPKTFLDWFFPEANYGHGREYWRAFGFVLAWPLFVFNWFTDKPMMPWLILGAVQTFVIIPALVWRFGKGAYCGWICSCGALAETLGDEHRHKMPHGPRWNRLNMLGQVILWVALAMMGWRIGAWVMGPESAWARSFPVIDHGYYWAVDMLLAGVLGVGFYFWYSGRVWCRFACPLAALMHIYARFSRFRILPEKKKCISCNVCTSVCHQGIDVMNFANKGLPMADPECVRCSACVQMCPTGTLQFGWIDPKTGFVKGTDTLAASPVRMAESQPV